MTEYNVYVKIVGSEEIPENQVEAAFEDFERHKMIAGPVVGGGNKPNEISAHYNVTAPDAEEAADVGILLLTKAISCDGAVVEICAEPYIDPELLISKAEIARRLQLSKARINQLAASESFPLPVKRAGRFALFNWRDIEAWQKHRRQSVPQLKKSLRTNS